MTPLPIARAATCALAGTVLASGSALAAPAGPAPVAAPAPSVCAGPSAWIETTGGDAWLAPVSPLCATPTQTPQGVVYAFSQAETLPGGPGAPRIVLRAGERVRIHFGSAPTQVVTLRTGKGRDARGGRTYRLSPSEPTWRVRPGRGVLVISTKALVDPIFPLSGSPRPVSFSAVYRTVR